MFQLPQIPYWMSWMSLKGPCVKVLVPNIALLGPGIIFKNQGPLGSLQVTEDVPSNRVILFIFLSFSFQLWGDQLCPTNDPPLLLWHAAIGPKQQRVPDHLTGTWTMSQKIPFLFIRRSPQGFVTVKQSSSPHPCCPFYKLKISTSSMFLCITRFSAPPPLPRVGVVNMLSIHDF